MADHQAKNKIENMNLNLKQPRSATRNISINSSKSSSSSSYSSSYQPYVSGRLNYSPSTSSFELEDEDNFIYEDISYFPNDNLKEFEIMDDFENNYEKSRQETNNIKQQEQSTTFLLMTPPTQHNLTLEELISARQSCWLCGCNWQQDHVSLDCSECGGYAMTRPCPTCDGQCKQVWVRNITATHDHHRALWVGYCALEDKGFPCRRKRSAAITV